MTANRSYQNPSHVPYDAKICPFTACLYHHNEAIALVMICVGHIVNFSTLYEYNVF